LPLQCAHEAGLLRVIIRDRGRPFDPREHPAPAPALVEELIRLVDEYTAGAPQADDMTLLIIKHLD
jgi:serine phosphatase RsbU (regulator of sigma subunit)